MNTPQSTGALSHLRILDFTALVQGPMATQVLGDLGADVVKLERPEGEWSRHWGIGNARTHGELDSFLSFNRNKRSVTVDLKDAESRAKILELAKTADVVVENFRPGVMDRLGIGYDTLREINPRIIYACSSGWGQSGPYRARPGQDMLAQATSGLLYLTGRRDDPPTGVGAGVADLYTGLHIVIAILAAVVYRDQSGEGQRVEVDLFSCVTALQQQELTYFMSHGSLPERASRNMGSIFASAPFGIYETRDGYVVIAMTPCPVLAQAIDLPEIARFDSNQLMVEHRDEIYDRVAARLATDDSSVWIERLLEKDVWCAMVQDYKALMEDPQMLHNGLIWDVPVGPEGADQVSFRAVGSPITMSVTPPIIRNGVPRLGQHTDEIFGE
jgi:crotonobetainyl-CoA:carnitine CoA-transferase CaiB-like acyl-CoA transferase